MNEQVRQDFLINLTKMTKEEITQFIIENGKKPKRIRPFIYVDGRNNKRNKEEHK